MSRSPPTIRDLATKECFICQQDNGPVESWVHPCKCTLVVHQACLLRMIDALPKTTRAACPQCGFKYQIIKTKSLPLELLRLGNSLCNICGTMFSIATICGVIVLTGSSLVSVLRSYGMYSMRFLFGDTIFDTLLTGDTSSWPWSTWLMVPLLALRCLFSGEPFRFRHLLAYILILPSQPPQIVRDRLMRESSTRFGLFSIPYDSLSFQWPPTRLQFGCYIYIAHFIYDYLCGHTIWACLLPIRPYLTSNIMFFMRWRRNRARRIENGGDPNAPHEVDMPPLDNGRAPPEEPRFAPEVGDRPPLWMARRILQSQSSPMLEAMFLPPIAKGMGYLLHELAQHYFPLQRILGIRPTVATVGLSLSFANKIMWNQTLNNTYYWTNFSAWVWSETDPVWLRNTIGLGIFVLLKDALHQLHLWLRKNEIESRHVKDRSFEGLDPRDLDLIHPVS
ncbi:hypothetical protein DFS33DRAFT_103323 [Desarmillaria ectypa]|nr:hypothetical protein DFS33DRAFT_103323 [Desarmillaria ectypa]